MVHKFMVQGHSSCFSISHPVDCVTLALDQAHSQPTKMTETDTNPTPNESPAETPPPVAQADASKALQTALTGVAGMVLGGLLLGKKGGLLAGLVGVGAKVLLQKNQPQTSATQADATAEPPTIPAEKETVPVLHAEIETSPQAPIESGVETSPVLEPLAEQVPVAPEEQAIAITHSEIPAASSEVLEAPSNPPPPTPSHTHFGNLLALARELSPPTKPEPEPEPKTEPEPVVDSHEGDLTVFPLDPSPPLPPLPVEPVSPEPLQPLHTEVELPAAVVEAIAAVEAELADEQLVNTETEVVQIVNETTEVPAPAELSSPVPVPTDIALEQALSQSEEFRNYGQPILPVPEAPAPIDALADLHDHLKEDAPWSNPILDAPTSTVEAPAEASIAEENDDACAVPAFVNWPGSEDEKTPEEAARATAFQQFVATMFSELAEPEEDAPKPQDAIETPLLPTAPTEPTGPVAASPLSSFIPDLAHTVGSPKDEIAAADLEPQPESILEPLVPEPITPAIVEEKEIHSPVAEKEQEPEESPEIPQLSPEDIWKLAAAESSDLLLPDQGTPATPAIEPFPFMATPAAQATTPSPASETLPSFASFADLISQASGPPISHSAPVEQPSPPGMDPFEELFGTSPETSAKDFFPTVEPREKPQAIDPTEAPISFPTKRAPLLSSEEEAEIDRFAETAQTAKVSPFSLNLSPQTAAQPGEPENSLPQPVRYTPRPPTEEPKPQFAKALLLLFFALLLAAGYAFRDPLLELWNQKFAPQKKPLSGSAAPASAPAPTPAAAVTPPTPTPKPKPTTEPAAPKEPESTKPAEPSPETPTTPTPPTTEPDSKPKPTGPTDEPKPAPVNEPEVPVPTPTPATEPPALITPPVIEPVPAKVEIRPASLLPDLPATPDAAEAASTDVPPKPEEAAQQKGLAAVKSFLAATTIEGVSANILNSAKLAPKLSAYYGKKAIAPTEFDNIVLDSGARVPETNSRAFLFRVRSPDRTQGFPVCVEETPEGYKIEWEAFIQCRDRVAANFWKDPTSPATSLFVIVKRSHYFEEDLLNLDDYECFRINSPNPDEEEFYAFSRKDSAFVKKNRMLLNWDANYFVVAQFTHVKNSKGVSHVEIVDIDRFNWRGQTR